MSKKIRAVIAYFMAIVLGVSTSADAGTNISFNGTTYTVPAVADASWGTNVSTYLIAIANGALQKSGGTFTLTQEVDFGGTYGLKAQYFKSKTATISSTGILRLGNNGDAVSWRNAANDADLALKVNGSNALQFNSISLADLSSSQTLTNKTMSGSSNTFTNLPSSAITGTLGADHGGTGIANNAASTLTISGAYGMTLTVSGTTALTLPTSGTLATLAGTETLTNKTMGSTDTLTGARIASFTPDGSHTLTAPAATDTLEVLAASQSPTNKTFDSTSTMTGVRMASITSDGTHTVTFPVTTNTLATLAGTETLTNKTLNGNTATNLVSGSGTLTLNTSGTATVPNATDTLVGKATTDTLTNKTMSDSTTIIGYVSDVAKALKFSLGGATTAKTMTIASSHTLDRTLTLPDATDTLVGRATTDTLTNKTLNGNTATNLISGSGTLTLNTSGTVTLPNATDTLVGLATTDTLTNKTLTSPKLNENVAVTTTATKLNYLTSATGTTGTTSTNVVFSTGPTLTSAHVATSLLFNGTSSGTLTIAPPATITDYTLTWPAAQGAASTVLTNNGSGTLSWGAGLTTALNSAHIFVGNGSNIATDTAVTGDVTITNAGVTAIGSGKVTSDMINDGAIVDADVNASAAIAGSKLAAASASVAGAVTTGTQTFAGAKTFNSGIVIGGNTTSDSNLNTISTVTNSAYYEGNLGSVSFTGFNTASTTILYKKIGTLVCLFFPQYLTSATGAANTQSSSAGAINTGLRPAVTTYFPVSIYDNGANLQWGTGRVTTAGTINIYRNVSQAGSNWTTAGSPNAGWDAMTVCYSTN